MRRLAIFILLLVTFAQTAFCEDADTWYMVPQNSMNLNLNNGNEYNTVTIDKEDPNAAIASFGFISNGQAKPAITFTFPEDFLLTSISQPYLNIPFGIDVVVDQQMNNGPNATQIFSFGYDDGGNMRNQNQNQLVLDGDSLHLKGKGGYIEVRLHLVLPDSYEKFEVGNADDYTVSITAECSGEAAGEKTYTVTLQGYYGDSDSVVDGSGSVMFSVIPGANARSLDIGALVDGSGIQNVEVGTYSMTTVSTVQESPDSVESPYYIYASASPYFDDDRAPYFRLTNISDPTSSFQYSVVLDPDGPGESRTFTGHMGDVEDTNNFIATETRTERQPDKSWLTTCYGSGTISILVDPNMVPDDLSAGYYSSDIYVHVVSTK